MEVKVARIKTKKNKILYTVAIVLIKGNTKMLSYQGRYKNKAAAEKKKQDIIALISENTKKATS